MVLKAKLGLSGTVRHIGFFRIGDLSVRIALHEEEKGKRGRKGKEAQDQNSKCMLCYVPRIDLRVVPVVAHNRAFHLTPHSAFDCRL